MGDRREFKVERVSGMPVDDEELLNDLRRVAGALHLGTIGLKEYRKKGLYDDTTVSRRFGTWNAALKKAGLQISNEVSLSDEVLFENLLVLWTLHGRQPRRSELALPPSRISQSPYNRRFGSWRGALREFVEFANASQEALSELGQSERMPTASGHRTPRDPSWRLRFLVLQRDGFRCRSCGASPSILPGVNLQTLCSRCNGGKSSLP